MSFDWLKYAENEDGPGPIPGNEEAGTAEGIKQKVPAHLRFSAGFRYSVEKCNFQQAGFFISLYFITFPFLTSNLKRFSKKPSRFNLNSHVIHVIPQY